MQFQSFLDDPMYTDQHSLHVEVIRTFACVGPNAEPKFRDECEYHTIPFVSTIIAAGALTRNQKAGQFHKLNKTWKLTSVSLVLWRTSTSQDFYFI